MTRIFRLALFCSILFTWFAPGGASAQFAGGGPKPGDVYKEFTFNHNAENWRVTDPGANTTRFPQAADFLPNPVLTFNVSDLQHAVRAEMIIDFWGGHEGTTNKRFRINGNSWITIPELDTLSPGNPTPGNKYMQQVNHLIPIPLAHLVTGANTLEGTSGPNSWGWGQWGWYGIVLRVYYDSSVKVHAKGHIALPSSSTLDENPNLSAVITQVPTGRMVDQVDYLAYYDGYDTDGDGIYKDWHRNYHRSSWTDPIGIKGHVGTATSAPYAVTWDTTWVPDQAPGEIKLIARIRDTSGTWYVTDPVTDLSLRRQTHSVRLYKAVDVPQLYWVRLKQTKSSKVNIALLSQASEAAMHVATWNGNENNSVFHNKVNNWTAPKFGRDHFYSFDRVTVPVDILKEGENLISWYSETEHHGPEILWPGPAVAVRYDFSSGGSPVVLGQPRDQNVAVGQRALFSIEAMGAEPLEYQWHKNGMPLPGVHGPSFRTDAVGMVDDGAVFTCVVSNGEGSVVSGPAVLRVLSGKMDENFESYAVGSDPPGWLDTGANNSMSAAETLFKVHSLSGNKVFGTTSTLANIHSHYTGSGIDPYTWQAGGSLQETYNPHYAGAGIDTLSAYEFTGRMMMTDSRGGIGVTFFSDYPQSDTYYRLRRFGTGAFHIEPHGTTVTGKVNSGVVPVANVWYRFKVQVEDLGTRTEMRARIWQDGNAEPSTWQIDALDESPSRIKRGAVGVWAFNPGSKYWDDFSVRPLAQTIYYDLKVEKIGAGGVRLSPEGGLYAQGALVSLTAEPSSGWLFAQWGGDATGTENPLTVLMDGDKRITATFVQAPPAQHTLTVEVSGEGTTSPAPGVHSFAEGSLVNLNAQPSTGWVFVGWSGGVADPTAASTTVHVNTDKIVKAFFSQSGGSPGGPLIKVWYGPQQVFGFPGVPQYWVNVLGNVSDPDGVASLTYSLNGGPEQPLSFAPYRRLENPGDFNVEIDYAHLLRGLNPVTIHAVDSLGNRSTQTVLVDYAAGHMTPSSYAIAWNSVGELQRVTQVVDGMWGVGSASVRPVRIGYDRALAVGDLGWRDYEVMVPITVHSFDPKGFEGINYKPAVGFLLRWRGHYDWDGSQPRWGYRPVGGGPWYEFRESGTGDLYLTDFLKLSRRHPANPQTLLGVPHFWKARVQTIPGRGSFYSFKLWPQGTIEPAAWQVTGLDQDDLADGSLLLVAHYVDASFGDVMVIPTEGSNIPTITGVRTAQETGSITLTWSTNMPSTSVVRYGLTEACELGPVGDPVLKTQHSVTLSGLSANSIYYYEIAAVNGSGFESRYPVLSFRAGGASTVKSDGFDGTTLDTSVWTFVNPLNDANWAMTGRQIALSVPEGQPHDVWSGNTAPRIMQSANDTDFTLEVKFDSTVSRKFQMQGLIIEADAGNFLRFDFHHDGTSPKILAASFLNGSGTVRSNKIVSGNTPIFMRVQRSGDYWTQSYSVDKTNWIEAANFVHSLRVTKVGVFAGNQRPNVASPAPGFTALIDYFVNTAAPLPPVEEFSSLTIGVTGGGTTTPAPGVHSVRAWEPVSLNAIPLEGWEFAGWTGGVTDPGSAVTTVFMNGDRQVRAVFVQPGGDLSWLGSDGFEGTNLDSSLWTFINPLGDGTLTMLGGQVALAVPQGQPHDVWTGIMAPRIMQWANDSDFEIEVKFDSAVTQKFQMQGLIVEADEGNFLRFDFHHDGSNVKILAASFLSGAGTVLYNQPIAGGAPLYMRVKRTGNQWTQHYSTDGKIWNAAAGFTHVLRVKKVGIFAGNQRPDATNPAPAFTAVIDYFVNMAAPLLPGGEGNRLTVQVSGGGAVARNPDKPEYALYETVQLTALPQVGWKFIGWSGAVSGTSNPVALVMDGHKWVAASFEQVPVVTHALTLDVSGQGTISPEPGVHLHPSGTVVALLAAPSAGWEFAGWTGDVADPAAPATTVTMDGDKRVRAIFIQPGGDPSGIFSDGFDGATLNTDLWTFINPLGDATLTMTGTQAAVNIPAGPPHDIWTEGNFAPRLMQWANDTDFTLEVKFDSALTQKFQMQGLIIEEDSEKFIRLDFFHDGKSPRVFAASLLDGVATTYYNQPIAAGAPLYMRVKRSGDEWTQWFSFDGTIWIPAANFTHRLAVSRVGVFAGNQRPRVGTNAPGFKLLIDYFLNTAAPLPPGTKTHTLTLSATTGGTTSPTPGLHEYSSWEMVTLTAAPSPGWEFSGWLGDVSDPGASTTTVIMNRDQQVKAVFTQPGGDLSGIVSDNFNSSTFNETLWQFINPLNDASLSSTGTRLSMALPSGASHDVWTSGNSAARIMQWANDTDFEIEVKFDSAVSQKFQLQGLLIEATEGNFIRFDFFHDGSSPRVFAASFVNGVPTVRYNQAIGGTAPLYMRVKRQGDQWTQSYSFNGTTWTAAATFSHNLSVSKVGPFVGNHIPETGSPAPAFTSLIDYFFNTSAPLVP